MWFWGVLVCIFKYLCSSSHPYKICIWMTVSAVYSWNVVFLLSVVINHNIMFYLIVWKTIKWDVTIYNSYNYAFIFIIMQKCSCKSTLIIKIFSYDLISNTTPQVGEWILRSPNLHFMVEKAYFLNTSTSSSTESTYFVAIELSWILSRMKWQSISMCLLFSWNTGLATMYKAALLSQYVG